MAMHSVLWASIFASGGVALLTTLLVEYFAKPSLEARKERILKKKREHRAALRELGRAIYLAHNILAVRDDQEEPVLRKRTIQYAADAGRLVLDAYEKLRIPREVYSDWTDATSEFMSLAVIIQERNLDAKHWIALTTGLKGTIFWLRFQNGSYACVSRAFTRSNLQGQVRENRRSVPVDY